MGSATLAALIFAATYVTISLRRIRVVNLNRPAAALCGAVLMVVTGVLSLEDAYRAINHDTIALLLGMMLVIAYLKEARFFEAASAFIVRRARTPRRLLVLLVVGAGLLSALFVNDTICLLFTPIVLAATRRARLDPVPYLIALVTGANVGSAMTLIGNPQDMLIGISSGISFARYLAVMAPVGVVGLALVAGTLLVVFRGRLPAAFGEHDVEVPRVHRAVVRRIAVLIAMMFLAWLAPVERWVPGLQPGDKLPLVALAGGVVAIAIGRFPADRALRSVDWSLLLFFTGLFVVVGGVAKAGILEDVHRAIAPLLAGPVATETAALAGVTVVGSNVVSNVPFVLVARDWVAPLSDPRLAWYVLAAASTFAGNLTIVGSVANVIVLEQAKEEAPIGFFEYLRAGLPVTLLTTSAAVGMLLGLRAVGWPL
jgi:Na+/H+ antiporter NhaD/arsenite permease-like protein